MALPLLRRIQLSAMAAATNTNILPAAIPAGRAFVISKVTVANQTGATLTFTLFITGSGAPIAQTVSLAVGQVYTEAGIVLTAGDNMGINCSVANGVAVHLFGQEVDN